MLGYFGGKAYGHPRLVTQREKELQQERKNKGDIFCWRNNTKFCSGWMLAATRVKMSDKEKRLNKNTSDISFIKRLTNNNANLLFIRRKIAFKYMI